MPRIATPIQIRFADLDMAHHAHNGVYLHWFELARMALLERFIPKGHDWRRQGLILARNEVDYRMPVNLRDEVRAEAWCSAIGTKSFDLSYAIVRLKDGRREVCAEGRSVMVCFDYERQASTTVPAEWREALEGLMHDQR
ncbi:MAG: acyl-CoA thioesterase [Flavobacteriales bacterium]